MNKEILINTAEKIGNRLINNALWEGNECTWEVMAPNREDRSAKSAVKAVADAAVYQGVAGIVLYLVELFRITNNPKIKDCINGALEYSYRIGKDMSNASFGFHSGRVGIAYALFKAGSLFNDDKLLNRSVEVITPLYGNANSDLGIDVIGGAGGSIQPLLVIYESLNDESILQLAKDLGDNLIHIAKKEQVGFAWGFSDTDFKRLCGYAHGVSGIGQALLELYNVTGEGKYLYGFEQTIAYENQYYSNENLNWPDFRYRQVSEYVYEGRIEQLKQDLIAEKIPPYNYNYMSAWCHGAPGIALNRLRAYELLHKEEYKIDAINSIKGTAHSFCENHRNNYSLCHGNGGNCEPLIYGSQVLNNSKYYEDAFEIAVNGIKKFEEANVPWPCGTMGSVSDPSLMLGEAGIGYYLLRLYSSDVPSVLVISSTNKITAESEVDQSYNTLKEDHIKFYFGDTLEGLKKLKLNFEFELEDTAKCYREITNFLENLDPEIKQYAEDLFQVDKIRFLKTIGVFDYSEEYRDSLIKEPLFDISWKTSQFMLDPFSKLIECKYDWQTYFTEDDELNLPNEEETYVLLFRKNNTIQKSVVGSLPALVLSILNSPSSLEETTREVSEYFDGSVDLKMLEEKVLEQIQQFYQAGLIKVIKHDEDFEKLVSKISDNLSLEYEDTPHYIQAFHKILQTIRHSKSIFESEDELNRLHQYSMHISDLKRSLNLLKLEKPFEQLINRFFDSEDMILKEVLYKELISELEISFGFQFESLAVNQ